MSDNTITTTFDTNPPAVPAPAVLSLGDIALSVNALRLATRRGGFLLEETSQIAPLVERLVAFIEANTPKSDEAPAVAEPSSDVTDPAVAPTPAL